MMDICSCMVFILSNFYFLFYAIGFALASKLYILTFLLLPGKFNKAKGKAKKPLLFLILVTISTMMVDWVWILWLFRALFYPDLDYKIILFFIRISWIFALLQYQALGLFIESLIVTDYKLSSHQKFFIPISSFFGLIFSGCAFLKHNSRSPFEYTLFKLSSLYMLGPLMAVTLFFTIRHIKKHSLPKILKKQIKIVLQYLITPFYIADLIQLFPFNPKPGVATGHFASIGISTILITCALLYSSRKIMGLRFLNSSEHIKGKIKFNFINDFKIILEQLSLVTTQAELIHITQIFFKQAFGIPNQKIFLYIRNHDDESQEKTLPEFYHEHSLESIVSSHIKKNPCLLNHLKKNHLWMYDEIVFSNFYEEDKYDKDIINLLDAINADIFIPIFDNSNIIGYIAILKNARTKEFYSNIEQDEMLVFTSYLANIINLLQNRNLHALILKEKDMQEELYNKHQEIQQYREAIRSFLRDSQNHKIGIIFYKNKRFIYANKEAKELVHINLNQQEGHPLTQTCKKLVQHIKEYKTSHTMFAKDHEGKDIVLSCIPHLDHNNLIILISYPEISDIIKNQVDMLKNPSEIDYLLYLETTKIGQLINNLIPGKGESLLNFKIEILKTALSKKATLLLQMSEEDIIETVEILHHISLREKLFTLKLTKPCKGPETMIKLFGLNPLLSNKKDSQGLLADLDKTGTLFIQNIEFLDLETQNQLAEFIKYGFYRLYKSEKKVISNVRIICSANQNLTILAQEGSFSKALLAELIKTKLSMPSLLNLPEEEVNDLVEAYSQQEITAQQQDLIFLSYQDKKRLQYLRPASLKEFKLLIKQFIEKKSKHHRQESHIIPQTDPTLHYARSLGKHALRKPEIMTLLWKKFKNQNKIAAFLGVNRSSVSRRYKQYNILGNQ